MRQGVKSILIPALLSALLACQPPSQRAPSSLPAPSKFSPPPQGAYTGAYIDFGPTEDDVSLEAIENFDLMVGKKQAIIASSSYWGEQSFPKKNLQLIQRYGAVPLVYWSPWDKPYDQDRGPDRFSLTNILRGDWDAYIDHWADEAKAYQGTILVAWGLEMNGTWFPWSGHFYGAGTPTKDGKFAGPELYKRTYRYVVDRTRKRGASNIQWVFHTNYYSFPQDLWNLAKEYYPGGDYVDWLGLSVYGQQFKQDSWISFSDAMDYPYQEIAQIDPDKPIMLAEWGVGEFPKSGNKAAWIQEAFEKFPVSYPRLKAAVFWHERWQNEDETYSNLRVNSSKESLEAYRKGVQSTFWIERPFYR